MKYLLLLFAVLFAGTYAESSNDKKVKCIHNEHIRAIGTDGYSQCYNNSAHLPIPRIKKCLEEVFKTKQIIKVAANKQMTVDKNKFKQFGETHSSNEIGKAVTACYNKNEDRIYEESARAIQCVFDQVKKGKCKNIK